MDVLDYLDMSESSEKFHVSVLSEKDKFKIESADITLKEGDDFKRISTIRNIFDRKNVIFYGKYLSESFVKLETASGKFELPIVNIDHIYDQISKIRNQEKRKTLSCIHISTIQIVLKSTFLKGLDYPISLAITDERINNPKEKIIGIVHGNLATVTLKFSVHLGFAIPLTEEDLSRSISLTYKAYRNDLMNDQKQGFSITYAVSYALANSHHSIQFANKDRIYLDEIFKQVSFTEKPRPISPIKPNGLKFLKKKPSNLEDLIGVPRNHLSLQPPPLRVARKDSEESSSTSVPEIENLTKQVKDISSYLKDRL
ncbi:putative movement protein [Cestrum yellow leaf curling virus]|uniref:Putative movement protein n=1 Tax=Cestrum yellow leaf curling virus TaxID=175814 RepID=MVP_CYLCV|nr:putative movement protein [Cestrum yellow leaf curling virus]Q7TD13.1 RecName: Full=Putative movement protein; Short=Mov; AltName: Full=Cell-to-cell transport protein [Cestrum yellow leaf curling virus]AAP78919.1 putative movement protein [Cestrum yellow leaf curling virus]